MTESSGEGLTNGRHTRQILSLATPGRTGGEQPAVNQLAHHLLPISIVILMKCSSAKRRRASIDSGRGSCASHSLEALSKKHLVALISELQAQNKSTNVVPIDNSADDN